MQLIKFYFTFMGFWAASIPRKIHLELFIYQLFSNIKSINLFSKMDTQIKIIKIEPLRNTSFQLIEGIKIREENKKYKLIS